MLIESKDKYAHYFYDDQNRIQGEFNEYHENGQLWQHSFYIDDQMQGECKEWWDNGQPWAHCFYRNNKRHGEYKAWCKNGKIRRHCFYINNKKFLFKDLPYPTTPEDRFYFTLKYDIPLLPVE